MQTTPEITRLRELARDVWDYQVLRDWSDGQTCREISHVGSTKTYKRILDPDDDLCELNIAAQLKNFEAAASYIIQRRATDRPAETEYTDFDNVARGVRGVTRALAEETNSRLVCIEGENGTGKDVLRNFLLRQWGKITVAVEATEMWRDSNTVPAGDILRALGARDIPSMPGLRWDRVHEELGKRKRILLINEAHHMGWKMLNNVKTIINVTQDSSRVVVVFLCIPALIRKLESDSYQEAAQLFGNRLCERVTLASPSPNEILTFLDRRGVTFATPKDAKLSADALAAEAPQYGNWKYVNLVSREARAEKARTHLEFAAALAEVKARRVTQRNSNRLTSWT